MTIKGVFHQSKTGAKVIQFMLTVLLSALLFTFLGMLVTKGDLLTIQSIKINQFFQHVGIFVIPSLLVAFLWSFSPFEYLKISKKPLTMLMFFAFLIMIAAIPAINLLGEMNAAIRLPKGLAAFENWMLELEKQAEMLTVQLLDVKTISGLLLNLFLIAILPAIGEELFFRGVIQKLLSEKLNSHLAIWLTAIIFSGIHFQFYGFIPRTLMGALFGYMLWWTGNLWVPILAHFTNNAIAVIFYFFYHKGDMFIDLDKLGTSDTFLYGIFSVMIVGILIAILKKYAQANQPIINPSNSSDAHLQS